MLVKKKRSNRKIITAVIMTTAAIIAVALFLHFQNSSTPSSSAKTGNAQTKGEIGNQASNTGTATTENSSAEQPGDNKSDTGGNTSATLLVPSGVFVSNHHPNLSGTPAPNTISSVCTTTPGAICKITFTKDNATVSLPGEVTDRGGSAYWSWKLQDYGLTTGSWQVQAVATLDGQTKSATDALKLEVSP